MLSPCWAWPRQNYDLGFWGMCLNLTVVPLLFLASGAVQGFLSLSGIHFPSPLPYLQVPPLLPPLLSFTHFIILTITWSKNLPMTIHAWAMTPQGLHGTLEVPHHSIYHTILKLPLSLTINILLIRKFHICRDSVCFTIITPGPSVYWHSINIIIEWMKKQLWNEMGHGKMGCDLSCAFPIPFTCWGQMLEIVQSHQHRMVPNSKIYKFFVSNTY